MPLSAHGLIVVDEAFLQSGYTQNFNTLPTTGGFTWANNSTLPGWYGARAGGPVNTSAVTADGSGNLADQVRHPVAQSVGTGEVAIFSARAGDVLLLQGEESELADHLPDLGCLPLANRNLQPGVPRRLILSVAIFGAAVAAMLTGCSPPPWPSASLPFSP